MKRLVVILILNLTVFTLFSQPYGNEWIDYDKEYFKVGVSQDGIYRISFSDLQNAGFPMSTDPRRLQLFHRGEEVAIYVEGQGDAVFNTTDFIEFYGERNDGTQDANLYEPSSSQPHPFYNIFSDSSAYFLTYLLTPGDGKRMESFFQNNIGLPAEVSYTEDILDLKVNQYALGVGFSTDEVVRFTYFDLGEGWTSAAIQENESQVFTVDGITMTEQATGLPQVEVLLLGRDNLSHVAEIFVGPNTGSLRSVGTASFANFDAELFSSTLQWNDIDLVSGSLVVQVNALGLSGANDLLSTSYIRLTFPKQFDSEGLSRNMLLNNTPGNRSYLEIENVLANSGFYDITNTNDVIRIGYNLIGTTADLIVDNTSIQREILLNNGGGFISPSIKKANFRDINALASNYIIISNTFLMRPAGEVDNPVKAYADYRASSEGGGYDTLVVDMEMLYNQFNFGETSPLAIYNFMEFMVDNGDPDYLFLIGKGLSPQINFHRNSDGFISVTKSENGRTYQIRDLVPPAGFPASDIAFTAGLNGTQFEPAVSVGRLPAKSSDEVLAYLNKVIETESRPFDNLNRKKLLHLSGGLRENELPRFRGYVDGFAEVAVTDFLGGDVTTIGKQLSSPIELINVADEVNNGLSMITFYGHSAPDVTDIDIGFVTDPDQGYSNVGRYPTILVNGCNAGEFFQANVLFGEDWILTPDKGAINFIAHTFFGFENLLRRYSQTFYEVGYGDDAFINRPIGDIQKEVVRRYMSISSPSPSNITQVQQMLLLGDPAVQLFGADKPDYAIRAEDIFLESFNDDPVTSSSDSFLLKAIVKNFGKTQTDSIRVSLIQTINSSSNVEYDSVYEDVLFQDTLSIVINQTAVSLFGTNRFQLTLDPSDDIDELNELNNSAVLEIFIPSLGTRNIFPLDFGIIDNTDIRLLAQSSDVFSGERDFTFEIDSVVGFDSPFKKTQNVSARVLAGWNTTLLTEDSLVYYWRTRFADPEPGENNDWSTNSFVFINTGQPGWAQVDFDQKNQNQLTGLVVNPDNRQFEFDRTPLDLSVLTLGGDNPLLPQGGDPNSSDSLLNISVAFNNIQYIIDNGFPCRNNSVNMVAFDKNTASPFIGIVSSISNAQSCGRIPQVINNFLSTQLGSTSPLLQYLDNVDYGDSVLLFTIGNAVYSSWSLEVKTKLEEIGLSLPIINSLVDGEPLIVLGRKGGDVGSATVIRSAELPVTEQQITFNTQISGIEPEGKINTGLIGPAASWGQLSQKSTLEDSDDTFVDLVGVSINGLETILLSNINDLNTDLSFINATEFPFLRLILNVSDQDNLDAPQLDKWIVTFESVAEGLLIPLTDGELEVSLQEGEPFNSEFGFWNISELLFSDSISVTSSVFNQDRRESFNDNFNIVQPSPGDTSRFQITTSTIGKAGINSLNIAANPRILPEVYYDNNVINAPGVLEVNRDNINPIIDVVFDGEYILDGDIISAAPLISIKVKDENPFLFKTDTAGVNIFLRPPCENCVFERVSFASEEVEWFAASSEEDFSVEYKPGTLEDGVYSFRVEANDASGNKSGVEPYLVNFEVINESSVTNFYPYPNPFSTSTRFVFTLTGSEVPDEIKIQIMTVSGKIVREITQDELGPVRIGNNISDYAWDGKDEFGDQLANGVYLYKVFVRQNGQSIDLRSTAGDKAFQHGIGKLYLLK